jgi:hypothetical protein
MVPRQTKARELVCTATAPGKACVKENLGMNYRNRNIYILSDSQAAIKALDKHQINSKLV